MGAVLFCRGSISLPWHKRRAVQGSVGFWFDTGSDQIGDRGHRQCLGTTGGNDYPDGEFPHIFVSIADYHSRRFSIPAVPNSLAEAFGFLFEESVEALCGFISKDIYLRCSPWVCIGRILPSENRSSGEATRTLAVSLSSIRARVRIY